MNINGSGSRTKTYDDQKSDAAPVFLDGNSRVGYVSSDYALGTEVPFDQTVGIDDNSGVVLKLFKFEQADGTPADLEIGDRVRVTVTYVVNGDRYTQTLEFGMTTRTTDRN